jgi:hypothetical protein
MSQAVLTSKGTVVPRCTVRPLLLAFLCYKKYQKLMVMYCNIVLMQYSVCMFANVRCKYLNFLQFSFNT